MPLSGKVNAATHLALLCMVRIARQIQHPANLYRSIPCFSSHFLVKFACHLGLRYRELALVTLRLRNPGFNIEAPTK